jgi:opacity protein-like surface antigen
MRKVIYITVFLLALSAHSAAAESSIDLYFGQVSTDSNQFTHTDSGGSVFSTTDSFSERPAFGIRASNWFASNPNLGIAFDLSYFRPDGEITAVDTLPLSLLLSIRVPAGEIYQARSKWFLYFSAGPALYLFDMHARLPYGDTFKGLGADMGLDARAGINWKASENTAIFIEFRHTRFDVDGTYEDFFGWSQESITMDIESNHINFGLSF